MKYTIHVMRTNPNYIEEIVAEDVSEMIINEDNIIMKHNDKTDTNIQLRANDGIHNNDSSAISLFGVKVGLKIDMSK